MDGISERSKRRAMMALSILAWKAGGITVRPEDRESFPPLGILAIDQEADGTLSIRWEPLLLGVLE